MSSIFSSLNNLMHENWFLLFMFYIAIGRRSDVISSRLDYISNVLKKPQDDSEIGFGSMYSKIDEISSQIERLSELLLTISARLIDIKSQDERY